MTSVRKKEGFQGQRAIIIPGQILSTLCDTHPVINSLYITDIGYYPNAEHHHRVRAHGSRQNILIYCVGGKGWARIEKQLFSLSAGEFIVLPANVAHEYSADEQSPWTIYWIHFKGSNSKEFVDMMMQKMGNAAAALSFQQSRIHLFEEMYTNLEKGYSIDNICYANVCLQYFLASCCFDGNYNHAATKEKKDTIDQCISYMQEHIDQLLSLAQIAGFVNLSQSHLTTLFKKKTGFSLIEYFNQLKTQKACQYLLFTDLRVNEIADKLGFEDPYYFTRLFTKVIGVSPIHYRSKRRE
jgi:AraC-like DNA-binding protein